VSAIATFFDGFGRAFSHVVVWAYLVAIVAFLAQPVLRSRGWRNLLAATFPGGNVRWRDAFGAMLVMHGAGTFLPVHGDEAVRVAFMKDRIDGASTGAVASTAGIDFALQLATLYLMLVAFGFGAATLTTVILIRTAQRVTVSLPGFLETGSQQAMIVAILSQGGFPAGQSFGFAIGSKITFSGLTIALALAAARVMTGPLQLRARLRAVLHRRRGLRTVRA
jgi:hypothetical protein